MTGTEPRSIEFDFLGQRIKLKTQESDEQAREVVEFVSRRLLEAEKRLGVEGSPDRGKHREQVALLALLDLSQEYIQAKRRVEEYQQQLDEKARQVFK